jgi:succinate dehydrogenase / fumarate reductase membrane anchor subunit
MSAGGMRSSVGRVRGLGSAKLGTEHWWAQRLTAVALIPLSLWFAVSVIWLTGADYWTAAEWLSAPVTAILLLLLIGATFHHAQLGLQVIVEDYVHHEGLKIATLLVVKFACAVLGLAAAFAVLKIAFGG